MTLLGCGEVTCVGRKLIGQEQQVVLRCSVPASDSAERQELGGQRRGTLGGRQGASSEVTAGAGAGEVTLARDADRVGAGMWLGYSL